MKTPEAPTVAEIQLSYRPSAVRTRKVNTPYTAFQIFRKFWNPDTIQLHEECKLLLLDTASHILGIYDLSKGGINMASVDIRLIASIALKCNATSVILAHNHPSGSTTPSMADVTFTNELRAGLALLNIKLLDHIIMTASGYGTVE